MSRPTRYGIFWRLAPAYVLTLMLSSLTSAGTYMSSSETYKDSITHPSGYTGTEGILHIKVCIDADATDAADMEISIKNVVKQINQMTASSPNLFFGTDNNIPSDEFDFESVVLHELGHCTGLGHPNLGQQDGVAGDETDYTATGDGADDTFAFGPGTDTVIGSSDDQRGDDQNLHWFEKGVNNPFLEVANPQSSNYSRDVADLPVSDDFPANASRDVADLLGFPNTEAVMQQGQFNDEEQRLLQADDVNTYRMAMTGFDETPSTADDYTINLIYGGIKTDTGDCDIVIESETSGFAFCSIGVASIDTVHWWITSATFIYNSDFNWYFNTDLNTNCSVGDNTLTFSNVAHNDIRHHKACESITYGSNYTVGVNGSVTATAPLIVLGPGTTINGTFAAIISIP